jgi:hypothetical protein
MIGPQFPDEAQEQISLKTLRQFAALCLGVFGLLFVLSWYRHGGHPTKAAWIAAVLAVFVGIPGLISPDLVRPVFLTAMAITKPIGHVVSFIMLGIIYYGFLTPLAILFRLMQRDNLARRRADVTSYWTPKPEPSDLRSYLRQYYKQ